SRPLDSNVANKENAVISEGTTTNIVKTTCKYFQKGSIPGSVNWWWNPTGIEKNKSKINDNLAKASEKIFPPIILGITAYHIMYAGMSQKYTNGGPKYQNKVRVNNTLTVSVKPSAQGIIKKIAEIATPIVAICNIIIVTTLM